MIEPNSNGPFSMAAFVGFVLYCYYKVKTKNVYEENGLDSCTKAELIQKLQVVSLEVEKFKKAYWGERLS